MPPPAEPTSVRSSASIKSEPSLSDLSEGEPLLPRQQPAQSQHRPASASSSSSSSSAAPRTGRSLPRAPATGTTKATTLPSVSWLLHILLFCLSLSCGLIPDLPFRDFTCSLPCFLLVLFLQISLNHCRCFSCFMKWHSPFCWFLSLCADSDHEKLPWRVRPRKADSWQTCSIRLFFRQWQRNSLAAWTFCVLCTRVSWDTVFRACVKCTLICCLDHTYNIFPPLWGLFFRCQASLWVLFFSLSIVKLSCTLVSTCRWIGLNALFSYVSLCIYNKALS